jgi:phage-related minor tail protein
MNDITDEAEQAFRREEKSAERLNEYQLEQQAIRTNYERLKRERKAHEAEA